MPARDANGGRTLINSLCCVCCVCALRSQLEVTPLANKTKINPNVQDANGKTALHYVVNPLDFGSYENVKLLALLVKSGADVNIKDKQGTRSL